MAKSDSNAKIKTDEFTRIFDEYRSKIEDITRKTEKNARSVDETPDTTADSVEEKLEEIVVSRPQSYPAQTHLETERPARESADIINEARWEAQRIIDEAEESARKEARKRTKSQIDKILGKAQKTADDIISHARQAAEKEKNEIIAASKRQAEYFIKEITEKCRQETQVQSSQIISEARQKASKMMADIITSSTEISQLVMEIVDKAKASINKFETQMRTDTDELVRAITETQNTLNQITSTARDEEEIRPVPLPSKNKEEYTNPTLAVRLMGEKSNGKNGNQSLFSGQVEMRSVSSSFDYQYLKNLKKYLVHIPSIKYLQESASEKETSVLFEVSEPVPLLDILSNIPLVEKVTTEADDIYIVFKNSS